MNEHDDVDGPSAPRRRPALSPSRAGDFKQCPLLYRFRAVDRLPETPTLAQARGTLLHAVLERLFGLPAAQRTPAAARAMITTVRDELCAVEPGLATVLPLVPGQATAEPTADPAEPSAARAGSDWIGAAETLLEAYFALEDPRRFEPAAVELLVETELASGTALRGYIDRLDVAPDGRITVVDYKTGAAPRPDREARAVFAMKFYALAVARLRGVVPVELRLLYLADGQTLTYRPDAEELDRFARVLDAIWTAILAAAPTGDFPPNPGPWCTWCDHRARCPAWDGTPPPYPGWPAAG